MMVEALIGDGADLTRSPRHSANGRYLRIPAGWNRREADIADRVVSMGPARSRRRVMTADLRFHPAAQPIHNTTFASFFRL
jgi:hypothetical protein